MNFSNVWKAVYDFLSVTLFMGVLCAVIEFMITLLSGEPLETFWVNFSIFFLIVFNSMVVMFIFSKFQKALRKSKSRKTGKLN